MTTFTHTDLSPTTPISVLIVDDHAIVRQGIRLVLEGQPNLAVVGEANDGDLAVTLALRLQPDLVLIDLLMPRVNGVEATKRIIAAGCTCKILILSSSLEDSLIKEAIRAGAHGYILKASRPVDLIQAIERAMAGGTVLDPAVGQILMRQLQQEDPIDSLTRRERDVFDALARGMNSPEIAATIGVAEGTIRTHIASVLDKLQLRDRTQVTVYALKRGLIRLEDLP